MSKRQYTNNEEKNWIKKRKKPVQSEVSNMQTCNYFKHCSMIIKNQSDPTTHRYTLNYPKAMQYISIYRTYFKQLSKLHFNVYNLFSYFYSRLIR